MGKEIARFLSERGATKIALIGRHTNGIETYDFDDTVRAKALVLSCDVTDLEAVRELVNRIHQSFGAVNGVIHAAGVSGGGLLAMRTAEAVRAVLAPKIHGTMNLVSSLENDHLDFFVFCSALDAVVGTPGLADHCAANSFLDAFAWQAHLTRPGVFRSINWQAWREVGQASTASVLPEIRVARDETLREGLTNKEGCEVLSRVLGHGFPQTIVSTSPLKSYIQRLETISNGHTFSKVGNLAERRCHTRPHLQTPYVEASKPIETEVASIMASLLAIDRVGIYDNFFELGGHSLLGLRLISRLNDRFSAGLSLPMLLEANTVDSISRLVSARLIEEIELMTEEAADEQLRGGTDTNA
jgi:acyl carrier protein